MHARRSRLRGQKSGRADARNSSQRMRAARSAPAGASVTSTYARDSSENPFDWRDGAPELVFDDENAPFEWASSCQVLGGRELVIERNQHAAAEKNGVGGNQPLGLIGHDDGGACAVAKAGFLQTRRERIGYFFELLVGEADVFAFAIGFDEANFAGPAVKRIAQRFAESRICEIEHQIDHRRSSIIDRASEAATECVRRARGNR